MIKSLGILVGGIFVGAVGAEILRKKYPKIIDVGADVICKKCPKAMDKLYTKTCEVTSGIKEAFKTGYENVMQPQ
jgi:hypothetical protein